jgi:4-hydroxy-tetrahydrodipicolinate reductase
LPDKYRTIHLGLGPIGLEILRLATRRPSLRPVAAVDISPDLVGRDAGTAAGLDSPLDITVSPDAESTLASTSAEVVIHSTASWLEEVRPQLLAIARAGKNCISTCEELAYPWDSHPDLAAELDREAKAHNVTLVGSGVNPGFVMDTLVLALTAACQEVRRIEVWRIVDVSTRRVQLQRKVGSGITLDEFRQRAAAGRFGHAGLRESALLIAHGLGWQLDAIEDSLEPVAADGLSAGVHQVVSARAKGKEVICLDLQMVKDVADPRDEIIIDGRPPIHAVLPGGIQGDLATAGVVINAIPAVIHSMPGLVTMADLALVTAYDTPPV